MTVPGGAGKLTGGAKNQMGQSLIPVKISFPAKVWVNMSLLMAQFNAVTAAKP